MKKFLAALLALSLTFGSVALPAAESGVIARGVNISASAETYEYGDFDYNFLDNGTIEITRYTGKDKVVTIPSIINGKKVTSIGELAFCFCANTISINIPNSITNIGDRAFEDCVSLTDITIPDSVTSIGGGAFRWCEKLTSITIPDSVTSIGSNAFSDCSELKSIKIPDSVTNLGDAVFESCSSLVSVTLPKSITNIGEWEFSDCTSLASIMIPDNITSIDKCAFTGCSSLTSVTISKNVTNIGGSVFEGCSNLANITVDSKNNDYSSENGVLFNKNKSELLVYPAGNSRKEYSIPDSVTTIGYYAFGDCTNLTSIIIPDSVTSMDNDAFTNCSKLVNITIPKNVTRIPMHAFYNCLNLTSITIPKSITTIDIYAFLSCSNLKNVYYTGSANDWAEIEIGGHNSCLTDATIHYNFDPSHIHSYTSSITKQPTCTEDGTKTFKCDCGDTYTETIPATGHIEVIDSAVVATCTTNGKTEGSHCSVCGEVIKAQKVVKATGHKFGSWSTTKSATCTESGTQTRKCSACGKTETQTIPAPGHKSSNWIVDKPAAIGVKGSKHKECTVCGKVLETAEIPALSKQNIQSATITLSKSTYVYDGKVKKPSVTVKLGSKTLTNGTDYTVSYSNNVKAGTATVKITGKGDYTGSVTKKFSIKNDFRQATITGISNKTYSGKSQTQKITVKFGGKTLKNGTDYTVSYSNNKKIGTASMKIVGKGDYSGTIDKTFKINPVKLSISKLAAKSKGFKAIWAKNDQATGYEIQYSMDSKSKSAKKVAITKKTTTAKTITKLKTNKQYYVRMRIYTTVNGTKYYGAWSAVKTVTTKK